ncbi:hypothetical protein N8580_01695 [Akkermansiaceae bacterium]|nr:hypothetical protein [Akkermansiaceae bacterium]
MNTFDFKNYLAKGGVNQQLTESQIYEEINIIFEEFLNDSVNENIIEDKTQLDESAIGLIAGGLLSAPKLLTLLGKLVGKISKLFGKDTSEEGVAAKIKKAGENLEKKYIKLLMKAIKLTGLVKKVWTKEDGSIDQDKLHDTAEVVFAVILAVAAISATGGAISAFKDGSALFGALETGLTGIKGAEIADLLGKVGSKLAA